MLFDFACGLVLCRDIQDAVGVDVEGDFDLRHAAMSWRNAVEDESGRETCCQPTRLARLE